VWPEGLSQGNIPMTPSGIEPVTFWLVAQYLTVKQCYGCKFMLKLLWHIANNRGEFVVNCINAVPATCFLCLNCTSVVLSYSGNTTIQHLVDIFYI
jgi:hypothetical protein